MLKQLLIAGFSLYLATGQTALANNLDNVLKTNTINCGYVPYAPAMMKNLKTNQWEGFDYEVMQAVVGRLLLKTNYSTTTGWSTIPTDLNMGKFDMLCSGYWVNPKTAKFVLFSRPFYFQPVYLVARANDTRFVSKEIINNKHIKIAVIESDNPVFIANTDFPQAKLFELPNMTDFSQVLESVATKKADITIVDANTFGLYNKTNPNKLKMLFTNAPVRIYPTAFAFAQNNHGLREAVNAALDELILDGTIDKIFDKYEQFPHSVYRARLNYHNPYVKN
jgi:ABC-type amino acid transport substrate-binding protein